MIQDAKPFPIASFRKDVNNKEFCFYRNNHMVENYPLHMHDYFEIEIIASGSADQFLNGTHFHLERGCAHILSTTDIHDLTITEPIDIYKILIHPEQSDEKIIKEIISNLGVMKFDENELSEVLSITEMLINESASSKRDSKTMINHLLNCLIIKFSRKEKTSTQVNGNLNNTYIKKAIDYIMLNYVNDISSIDIAKHIHMNPAYFSTKFHIITGSTVTEYITNLRLNRAYTMLSMKMYTVSEICYACGFNSSSNFLRAFKKKYGISPNELKKSVF